MSRQLLRMLEMQDDRTWCDIVTLDESWFYLVMNHEIDLAAATRKNCSTGAPYDPVEECILRIVWNPCVSIESMLSKRA
jgi:hypothetical protein